MRDTPSSETRTDGRALIVFLLKHHAGAQASTEIWEEKEEVSGREEKQGFLLKENVIFSLGMNCF